MTRQEFPTRSHASGEGHAGCGEVTDMRPHRSVARCRESIWFEVDGCRLHGMLEVPAHGRPCSDVGILMLNSDDGCRLGPHGLWVRMAERLAMEGYPSLRFDYRGCGDSEGPEVSPSGVVGLTDAIEAERVLRGQVGVNVIVLLGICYGAEVALLASRCIKTVCGVVACSTGRYVTSDGYAEAMGHATQYLRGYAQKLLRVDTWRKLLAGNVRHDLILEGLSTRLSWKHRQSDREGATDAEKLAGSELRRIPQLFIYGSADPLTRKCMPGYQREAESLRLDRCFKVIEGADHNYASLAWSREVIEAAVRFVKRRDNGR